jgi:ABC-2 type transport system permease protein
MGNQARAIIWAQWRSIGNRFPRSNKVALLFSGLLTVAWYGIFAFLAGLAAIILERPQELRFVRNVLPAALLICFLYWQLIPVLMASMGSSLDIRKLLVYPIPQGQLYTLEVLLRVSTGIEMLLLMAGAAVGLWLNPAIPFWTPAALAVFVAFNLFCSAGVRDLLVRLLARKRVREITALFFVLAAALPQLLVFAGFQNRIKSLFGGAPASFWPWTATARLALGEVSFANAGALLAWTAAAYLFGRWQFHRSLGFDAGEAKAAGTFQRRKASRIEWLYRLPGVLLRDPLAALVEKELRFLSRTSRFRLVFLMGFSFGLLIWAPIAFGETASRHSLVADNYLTFVSVYALLLLSDALFWNCFGFDRSAAQVYFLVPLKMSTVLLGKNLAAAFIVFLEIASITIVCTLLRMSVTPIQVVEAIAVASVVTMFMLAIGNLSSVSLPRSVNPSKSFRTASTGRTQALLMFTFPATLIPVFLAYLARYAFESEWAFFGVLLLGGMIGALVYSYAMASAVQTAEQRKEQIIAALSQGEGPIEN